MSELTELTLTEAARLIRSRALSAVELTRAYLDRIERLESRLLSFITVTAETALAEARAADAAIGRGDYRGVLHGIPLAYKDLFETRGVRTTAGSIMLLDHVPLADAAAVERLRAAGAICLGKLNMHEWAFGVTTNNPFYGACRNPWAPERIPGGSSGGAGAALAARLCLGALGSDTGGSIRIPAALCGIVGLKPTYGRVSLRGVLPLSWSLDHAGPMARRVADAAHLLQITAGYDAADPGAADAPVEDYTGELDEPIAGWRFALAEGGVIDEVAPEVRAAVSAAAAVFESLGARVEPLALPAIDEAHQSNNLILSCEAAAYHRERLAVQPHHFGADVLTRLRYGAARTAVEYALARRAGARIRRRYEAVLAGYDLLLLPTTLTAAPPREAATPPGTVRPNLTRLTSPFNLTGLPALSVPCGFTAGGLPIGLQLVGWPWSEALILRAGHAYEQATDWHKRVPAL
jgi:aspartyl-tRNA(Asn)/glutamyl-tRNA(Gln) amidotransferase subunit A